MKYCKERGSFRTSWILGEYNGKCKCRDFMNTHVSQDFDRRLVSLKAKRVAAIANMR
jgi:hypothetical protein